jgi:hypothetical protein
MLTSRLPGAATLVATLLGCAGARGPSAGASPPTSSGAVCEPPPTAGRLGVTLAGLAGPYRLRLVATDGARAGAVAEGPLRLTPLDTAWDASGDRGRGPLVERRSPVAGWLELDLRQVGATTEGAVDRRLGFVARERRVTPGDSAPFTDVRLTLQGAGVPPGVIVQDGFWTTLRVTERGTAGFRGWWESAPRSNQAAAGYFCADRA